MRSIVRECTRLFSWDFCYLAHHPPGEGVIHIIKYVDTIRGSKKTFPGATRSAGAFSKPIGRVLRGRPVLINRTKPESDPVMQVAGSGRRSLSLMYVPVRSADSTIGVLTLQSYTRDCYTSDDLVLLQQVADLLAPVLKRVYAEQALRKMHRELEQRVKQRTAELEAANRRLQRETRERQRALDAAEEIDSRFRMVTEKSLSGIYIFGRGRMRYVNEAFARIFGFSRAEITRMDPYNMVHPDDRALAAEQIRRRMSGEVQWSQYRFRGLRKNGEVVYCEALGRHTVYQGEPVILGNMLNITDRIKAEQALRTTEASLRRLTTEADRRLESERVRIARELHDGLGQVLTALNMNLAWAGRKAGDDVALAERLAESTVYVGEMTAIIRRLCKSLHPVVLDHHGLAEAIRTLVAEFQRYSRVRCALTIHPVDIELPEPLALAVFRIVQEALTNIARHSGAAQCRVSVRLNRQVVTLKIRDDGRGDTAARLSGSGSLGVVGMRERAVAAGGEFSLESHSGEGVQLVARLPLVPPA